MGGPKLPCPQKVLQKHLASVEVIGGFDPLWSVEDKVPEVVG